MLLNTNPSSDAKWLYDTFSSCNDTKWEKHKKMWLKESFMSFSWHTETTVNWSGGLVSIGEYFSVCPCLIHKWTEVISILACFCGCYSQRVEIFPSLSWFSVWTSVWLHPSVPPDCMLTFFPREVRLLQHSQISFPFHWESPDVSAIRESKKTLVHQGLPAEISRPKWEPIPIGCSSGSSQFIRLIVVSAEQAQTPFPFQQITEYKGNNLFQKQFCVLV